MKSDEEVLAELERATVGLLFISESDYPFEIVYWKELQEVSPQLLRSLTGHPESAPVEIVSLDDFFRVAVSEESWRSEESRRDAKKYRNLVRMLKDDLDEVKVYRIGGINISVYIIGRNRTGNWLGVSTRVVET